VIATKDGMHLKMLSVIQQLLARGAQLLVVCTEGDADMEELCGNERCSLIRVPEVREPGRVDGWDVWGGWRGAAHELCGNERCSLIRVSQAGGKEGLVTFMGWVDGVGGW